jgi:hypothetical protein
MLDRMASQNTQKLDWRHSIVDLMKLVGLDSSLTARRELAPICSTAATPTTPRR